MTDEYSEAKEITLLDRTMNFVQKIVKHENKNIMAILDIGILGLTGYPTNLLFDAPPSEGETFMMKNTLDVFPQGRVKFLRDASPKAFVHDTGELGVKEINEDGDVEYKTMMGTRDGEISVAEYLSNLQNARDVLEKKAKKNAEEKENLMELEKQLRILRSKLVTIIDFEGRLIAFLDQPSPELLKNLLSVLSHDSYYIETEFTEGEGIKHTRHVVFKGWPSFIFAVSHDAFLNWRDIETRFEVREPNMSPQKYKAAVEYQVKTMFGSKNDISNSDELKELKREILEIIEEVNRDKQNYNLQFLIPIDEREIVQTLFGNNIQHGDEMRKIPRIMDHIRANAIWNYEQHVFLYGPAGVNEKLAVINADDIRSLNKIYSDVELNSTLSGMPASLYEFWSKILTPSITKDLDGEFMPVKQSNLVDALKQYCNSNVKTSLKPGKLTVSRDLTKLEERGLIKRIEDDEDKRGRKIITLVDPEEYVTLMNNRIEALIAKISFTLENGDDTILHQLVNKNYTAFVNGRKLVSHREEILGENENEENNEKRKLAINQEIIRDIAKASGYSINNGSSNDTNSDTVLNVALKMRHYLLSHDSTESLGTIWNLLKEWTGKEEAEILKLTRKISEGKYGISFNFPTQTVILKEGSG